MRRIFWGFCRNWFLMSPLHYLSGRSDFGFRKTTPRYHQYGESPTLRIGDTGSRRLRVSVMRGVVDSPTQRYGDTLFLLNKYSIYTHDGASAKLSTNSHKMDYRHYEKGYSFPVPSRDVTNQTLPG
jgi:hypothetical protein